MPIGTCTERLSTRVHGKRWHAPLGNMLFPGSHKLRALFLTVMFFRMGSDGKYEPSELAKISFEEGCQFYSLKVPKGFDVKKLKVQKVCLHKLKVFQNYEIGDGLTQYETGIEVHFNPKSSGHVVLDPTSGNIGASRLSGEVT